MMGHRLQKSWYSCQETGHYARNFPSSISNTLTGSQSLQVGPNMNQTKRESQTSNIINSNWILVDTFSTISFIMNKNLFQNIQLCDAGEELRAYINRGHQDYDHTTTFKNNLLNFSLMSNYLQTKFPFPWWRPSSGTLLTHNWAHAST